MKYDRRPLHASLVAVCEPYTSTVSPPDPPSGAGCGTVKEKIEAHQ